MFGAGRLRAPVAALALGVVLCLGPQAPARAHGGHEEGPPPPSTPLSPRIVAESNSFELVGVAHGKMLTFYLDRFSDNAPVTDAQIDVQVDGKNYTAKAEDDGDYTLTADWVAAPGRHDLVITIMSPKDSDLLAGMLEIPSPAALAAASEAMHPVPSQGPAPASNMVAFLLGMLGAFVMMGLRAPAASLAARMAPLARGAASVAAARLGAARASLMALPGKLAARLRHSTSAARAGVSAIQAGVSARLGRVANDGIGQSQVPAPARHGAAIRASGERVAVSVVAVICLVVIALLLIGRSVFAHEGHEQGAEAAVVGGNSPHRLLDGSLFVPKMSQRLLNVRTTITHVSEVSRTIRVVGEVIADPGTSGEIHATIRGRLEPANGVWPRVGQKVEAGQVLAWVVPVVNPIDRGIILQQVAQIDHEIGLVQDRLKHLTAEGKDASARELDDARSDLENLARRRTAIAAVVKDRDNLRAPLLAPASGVIAMSYAVAGQVVDEQQKLFSVVDPRRLWVQAYAYDVMAIGKVLDANAIGSTGHNYALKFVSRGPQLQKQTIPLYFQIENPDSVLSVGSLVSVLVKTSGERSGVVLPRSAVVRDASGEEVVWKHAYPESFVPVAVRAEPIDGNNVLIAAGLKPNTRVVVQAADLLSEVR